MILIYKGGQLGWRMADKGGKVMVNAFRLGNEAIDLSLEC
jgi:hypothetical protein